MNVPQAFDKCHRSDPCLNWMKMKAGWFFMKKSLSNTVGLGLFRRKGKEIDGHE
jgi:hypothetical protein